MDSSQNVTGGNIFNYTSGVALGQSQQTASSFATALGVGAGSFVLQLIIYQLLKSSTRFQRIYQPRTYLLPERQKSDPCPPSPFRWFHRIWSLSTDDIIARNGMDAFVFLRYFRMLLKIFVPLALLVPTILLPINTIGGNYQTPVPAPDGSPMTNTYNNQTGLNTLAWGNVASIHPSRYWAHVVLAVLLVGWCGYIFFDELVDYIQVRQRYLTSPEHRLRASASTVLVMNIPPELQSEKALTDLFDVFPGGLRKIWLNRNYDALADKVSRRKDLIGQLEDGETNLIRNCLLKHQDDEKKASSKASKKRKNKTSTIEKDNEPDKKPEDQADASGRESQSSATTARPTTNDTKDMGSPERPPTKQTTEEVDVKQSITREKSADTTSSMPVLELNEEYSVDKEDSARWQSYQKSSNRDTMRILRGGHTFFTTWSAWWLISIPFTKTVDRIYYSRKEIAKLNLEIEYAQKHTGDFPVLNSAFIQFNNQAAAHMCVQATIHHAPAMMNPRLVEIGPNDVLWYNLSLPWWNKRIREFLVLGVFVGILFLWAVPFALAGFIANIGTVGGSVSWLVWVTRIPKAGLDVIQGLLPALLLQLLQTLGLPALLRLLCHLTGVPSYIRGERLLQRYYFAFLFIEVFLVSTVSSGLTATIQQIIEQPYSIPSILAKNLPQASNYFLSYVVLQALSVSAGQLVQTGRLFVVGWSKAFLNPTPRSLFFKKIFLQHQKWGQLFPFYTNIACIALVYSVISPIILYEILLTFSLFWMVYRNNNIFVYRNQIDGTGVLFPTAVFQLFTGLYVLEISMIGLLFLVRNPLDPDAVVCFPQAIVMIVALLLTLGYQFSLMHLLGPVLEAVPITLEDDAVARDEEFRKQMYKRLGLEEADVAKDEHELHDEIDHADRASHHSSEKGKPAKWYHRTGVANHRETQERILAHLRLRHVKETLAGDDSAAAAGGTREVTDEATGSQPLTEAIFQSIRQRYDGLMGASKEKEREKVVETEEKTGEDAEKGNIKGEDAIPAILSQFNDDLSHLLPADRDALVDVAYTDPALRAPRPIIWLAEDELGIAEDEISRMQKYSSYLRGSTKGAYFKKPSLKSGVTDAPPDFSEYWLIEPEL